MRAGAAPPGADAPVAPSLSLLSGGAGAHYDAVLWSGSEAEVGLPAGVGAPVSVPAEVTQLIDEEGSLAGAFVTVRDLRGREQAPAPGALGELVAGSGALGFQIDLTTDPATWWLCGDRSLVGLLGLNPVMTRVAPGELSPDDAALLQGALAAGATGESGARIVTVALRGRQQRWLAVRSRAEYAPDGTRAALSGIALDVTDRYLGVDEHALDREPAATLVVRIGLGRRRRLEFVSPGAEHFTGYSAGELLAGGLPLLRSCLDPALQARMVADVRAGRAADTSYEYRTLRRDGTSLWVRTTMRIVGTGEQRVLEITAVDVHQAKLVELHLSRLLLVDGLTGAASRQALEHEWSLLCARRDEVWTIVAHVDIDRFGLVNAGLGMPAGDELLRTVAERLAVLGGSDAVVGRIGADDFVVIAGGHASQVEAVELVSRLVDVGAEPVTVAGREVFATVSVGAAVIDPLTLAPDAQLDECLAQAEVALRAAKARHGGTAEIFTEQMRSVAQRAIDTHSALRRGIERDELVLCYQPIVDLGRRRTVGVEALVRWQHPTRGLLLPGEFIPLAEETGTIVELGSWVLSAACRAMQQWRGAEHLSLAVNLAARQLAAADLVERVAGALEESAMEPDRLVLEITETSVIHDLEGAGCTLHRLRDLGVHLALDDFGTGYSSLSYLVRLPVDRVKIDQSLVAALADSAQSRAIVAGVVGMAEAMDIAAIAEGSETDEQVRTLEELGCPLAQGFYFSPPVPAATLLERLATEGS